MVYCTKLLSEALADKAFISKNIQEGGIAAVLCQTAIRRIADDEDGVTVEYHGEQEVLMLIDQWIEEKRQIGVNDRLRRALARFRHSDAVVGRAEGRE